MTTRSSGARAASLAARLLCLCLFLALPLLAAAPVIVGSDRAFPPYEYVDAQGRPTGFLVDLVRAAAAETGLAIEVRPGVWNDLRNDLENGRIDLLTGMFATDERTRRLQFSVPHSYPVYAIFRRKDGPAISTEDDLRGRTTGVEQGDLVHQTLHARGLRVTGFPSPREALAAVAAGRIDCAVVVKSVGLYYVREDRLDRVVPSGPSLFPQKYCFAVRKGSDELLSRINEGLFILKGSGRYAQLYDQYFGQEAPAETPFTAILRRSLVVLGPLLAILAGILAWNRSLRRRVRQRTLSLQEELAERRRVTEDLQAAQARYTRLFRSMTDAYVQVAMDGRILDANPACQRMLGYGPDELRERSLFDLIPAARHEAQRDLIDRQVIPRGSSRLFETELQRKDGSRLPVEVTIYLLLDDQGRPSGMWGIIRDISERLAALKESRGLQELLETVIDTADVWINTLDAEARPVIWNQAAERISGYTRAEVQGNPAAWEWLYPDPEYRADITRRVGEILKSRKKVSDFVTRIRDRHGEDHLIAWDSRPLLDPDGQLSGSLAIGRDVTESRRAEESLKDNERMLAHLVANVPGYLYQCANEPGWPIVFMSEGCKALTGYPPEMFIRDHPLRFSDLIHPDYRDRARDGWAKAIEAAGVFEDEYPIAHADGSERWLWERSSGIHDEAGRLLLVEGFVTDVTGRKRAEQAYTELQEAWTQFVRLSPVYIYIKEVGPDGSRVVLASDNFVEMTGIPAEDMVGRTMEELFPPDLAGPMTADDRKVVERGEVVKVDEDLGGRSFTSIKFPIRVGSRTWLGGYTIDVTDRRDMELERRRLESQLLHAQKMESMGSLAGGVAHDMNNVLGAILSLASVELENAPQGSALRQNLETITRACVRGGTLVKGLLGFARQSLVEERPVDLNALVREELALLERTTLQKVRLSAELAEDLAPVQGDPAALSHALMNLCVNAVDAMPQGGSLVLRTRNDGPSAVLLEVADTGQGMPPEVLGKAMDPFFTTKPQGQGTGLGLAIVYGTVKAHRGEIRLRSAPGVGTTVTLRLPARQAPVPVEPPAEPAPAATRSLRVLVVDDDDLVRESTSQVLEVLGHRTIAASGGEQALELLAGGLEVDLVVLDLNMPGLGGAETLPRIRALRPDLPVLVATGRPDQQAQALVAAFPNVSLLPKPFTVQDLAVHLG